MIAPPVLQNSEEKKLVWTLNSCTTSTEGWYSRLVMPLFCSTLATLMPSSKTSAVEFRGALATKLGLDWAPGPRVEGGRPGGSATSARGARPGRGQGKTDLVFLSSPT